MTKHTLFHNRRTRKAALKVLSFLLAGSMIVGLPYSVGSVALAAGEDGTGEDISSEREVSSEGTNINELGDINDTVNSDASEETFSDYEESSEDSSSDTLNGSVNTADDNSLTNDLGVTNPVSHENFDIEVDDSDEDKSDVIVEEGDIQTENESPVVVYESDDSTEPIENIIGTENRYITAEDENAPSIRGIAVAGDITIDSFNIKTDGVVSVSDLAPEIDGYEFTGEVRYGDIEIDALHFWSEVVTASEPMNVYTEPVADTIVAAEDSDDAPTEYVDDEAAGGVSETEQKQVDVIEVYEYARHTVYHAGYYSSEANEAENAEAEECIEFTEDAEIKFYYEEIEITPTEPLIATTSAGITVLADIQNAFDVPVELVVSDADSESLYESIETYLKEQSILASQEFSLDISFRNIETDEAVQPKDGCAVAIRVEKSGIDPEATYHVIHTKDEAHTLIDSSVEQDAVLFSSDSFSTFTIAKEREAETITRTAATEKGILITATYPENAFDTDVELVAEDVENNSYIKDLKLYLRKNDIRAGETNSIQLSFVDDDGNELAVNDGFKVEFSVENYDFPTSGEDEDTDAPCGAAIVSGAEEDEFSVIKESDEDSLTFEASALPVLNLVQELKTDPIKLSGATLSGVRVNVTFAWNTFDEEVKLNLKDVKPDSEEVQKQIEFIENELDITVGDTISVDISFLNEEDVEVEPQNDKVSVEIISSRIDDSKDNYVIHTVEDEGGNAVEHEIIEDADISGDKASFETEVFSIYTVASNTSDDEAARKFVEALIAGKDINLERDIKLSDDIVKSVATNPWIIIGEENDRAVEPITINLNGHTIDLTGRTGSTFCMNDGRKLIINGGTGTARTDVVNYIDSNGNSQSVPAIGRITGSAIRPLEIVGGSSLEINGVLFDNNTRVIQAEGNIYIRDAYFVNNNANSDENGGVIYNGNSNYTIDIEKSYFTNNTAKCGGVICSDSKIKIASSTFSGNRANGTDTDDGNGGAIYAGNGIEITSGSFRNNYAKTNGGGVDSRGTTIVGTSTSTAADIVFDSNEAGCAGGAMQIGYSSCAATIYNGTFQNNFAGEGTNNTYFGGGAIRINGQVNLTVKNGQFLNNESKVGGGGAIRAGYYNGDNAVITINGGNFEGNRSKGEGGAVSIGSDCYARIEATNGQVTFRNNEMYGSADWGGGALFCADGGTIQIIDSVIRNNSAGGYGGGVAGCSTGRILIGDGGTAIYGNSASGENLSAADNVKPEDKIYTANDRIFRADDDFQDYFSALHNTVSNTMLGGGKANWKGSVDGSRVDGTDDGVDVITSNHLMGLTSYSSDADQTTAYNNAKVIIENNHSNTHGGGLLANGVMILGGTIPDTIQMPTRIMVSAVKQIKDGDSISEHTPFLFKLYEEVNETISEKNADPIWSNTENNTLDGDVPSYGFLYTVIEYPYNTEYTSEEGKNFVYYLAEDQNYLSSQYNNDPTVYKFTVNVKNVTQKVKFNTGTETSEKEIATLTAEVVSVYKGINSNGTFSEFKELTRQSLAEINIAGRYGNGTHYAAGDYFYNNEGYNHASELCLYPVKIVNSGAIRPDFSNHPVSGTSFTRTFAPSFLNTTKQVAITSFTANKTLTGKALKGGDFAFRLEAADSNPVPMPQGVSFTSSVTDDTSKTQKVTISGVKLNSPLDNYNVAPRYQLKDLQNNTIETVTAIWTSSGWSFAFPVKSLTHTSDESQDYRFELKELSQTNVQLDTNTYTIHVEFNAKDEGHSSATIQYDAQTNGSAILYNTLDGQIQTWPIEFKGAGTYRYKISEVIPAGATAANNYTVNGMKYDAASVCNVEVVVTGNESEGYKIGSVTYSGKRDFSNEYTPGNTKVTLTGTKTLTGRAMKSKEFTFEVLDSAKNVVSTGTNKSAAAGSAGVITFDPIWFSEAGTYTFTIREKTDELPGGVTSKEPTTNPTITVSVTADSEDKLTATVASGSDSIHFVNEYKAEGEVSLSAIKTLDGKDLIGNDFTFVIMGDSSNGDGVDTSGMHSTANNASDGTIDFGKIKFTKAGTYVFTVKEDSTDEKGITTDKSQYKVTYAVSDKLDGTFSISRSIVKTVDSMDQSIAVDKQEEQSGIAFTNKYKAKDTSIKLTGTKVLTGRDMKEGEFSFEVKEGSKVVATGKSKAASDGQTGEIEFTEIKYDEAGNHIYTVTETGYATDSKGIAANAQSFTVVVNVTDNKAKGELEAAVSSTSPAIAFSNTYTTTSTSITLTGTKQLTGRDMTANEFTFEVKEGSTVVATGHNVAADAGEIAYIEFSSISYSNKGDHTYTITEKGHSEKDKGIEANTQIFTVKVKVTDDGVGGLSAAVVSGSDDIAFTNTYSAAPAKLVLKATKTSNKTLSGGEFSFTLTEVDASGNELTGTAAYSSKVTNKASGDIEFPEITYSTIGTHYYKIAEANKGQTIRGVKYSDQEYTVTVTVTDPGDGQLVATAYKTQSQLTFHNEYITSVSATKAWNDDDNRDGKRAQVTLHLNKLVAGETTATIVSDKDKTIAADATDDALTVTWTDLPAYENGKAITYSVTEEAIDGYITVVSGNASNGFTVTNTHTPEKVTISGVKTWDDADNQDGKRPESITINLLADGHQIKSVASTAANGWKYAFSSLPKYRDHGTEIVYTITEEEVEEYDASIDHYDVTNTHTPATVMVSGTKTWVDAGNQDGKRPESITVNLLADGTKNRSVTVTADNAWTYSFTDLPKYQNGSEVVYTVSEDDVEGYTATVSGYNITNTHTPETISVSGGKTWDDADDQDGKRPDSITVNLLADGDIKQSKQISSANDWKWSFDGLPKYNNGVEISYTITENAVTGYSTGISGYNITNTHTPETTSFSATKVWDDNNNQDGKRRDVVLHLNKQLEGQTTSTVVAGQDKTIAANATGDDLKVTWIDLPAYENGKAITYSVTEETIDGYDSVVSGDASNGFTVTNTHTPEKVTISGVKTWDDADNQDGKRPGSITINLLANGTQVDSKTVTAADGWSYSFTDKPKYANGAVIDYTITEDPVTDYETNVSGYDVTNTHTPEKIKVEVEKTWVDNNNADGNRPGSVTVQLMADGAAVDGKTAELTSSNGWKATFDELDKYRAGSEIVYTVEEQAVTDYTVEYAAPVDITGGKKLGITNTYTPARTSVSVKKSWDDWDNIDGSRPGSVSVRLYENGSPIGSAVTLNSANSWSYTWTGLPVRKNGAVVTYTVMEPNVPSGYTVSISGSAASGFEILNSHKPKETPPTKPETPPTPPVTPPTPPTPPEEPEVPEEEPETPPTPEDIPDIPEVPSDTPNEYPYDEYHPQYVTDNSGTTWEIVYNRQGQVLGKRRVLGAGRARTGDESNLPLWGGVAAASLLGIGAVALYAKRRKKDEEES